MKHIEYFLYGLWWLLTRVVGIVGLIFGAFCMVAAIVLNLREITHNHASASLMMNIGYVLWVLTLTWCTWWVGKQKRTKNK